MLRGIGHELRQGGALEADLYVDCTGFARVLVGDRPGALESLGFSGLGEVRQGKVIDLELEDSDPAKARARVEAMCRALLANTVIENYVIDLD